MCMWEVQRSFFFSSFFVYVQQMELWQPLKCLCSMFGGVKCY